MALKAATLPAQPSIEATSMLMNHPGIAIVLATGGAGMVKSFRPVAGNLHLHRY